jgi:hypothetical protein
VLRCKGIESETAERSLFRILEEDQPAGAAKLERVARLGDVLLRENDLAGRFAMAGPGLIALELAAAERTFFHNGIVFAAIDAYNDPVKNPTLTLSADEVPGEPPRS